jgi:hypothetical protein
MRSLIPIVALTCFATFTIGRTAYAALTDGLVLYMTFEGAGDSAIDTSPEGNDGEILDAAVRAPGQEGFGSAISLDGTKSSVRIPHSDSLSITQAITVMAWTFMDDAAQAGDERIIVSKGGWGANDLPYELTETAGGIIYWQFHDDNGHDGCAPPSPPTGEWHHLAGTYDGDSMLGYIDGEQACEEVYAGELPANLTDVVIGERANGGRYFHGMLDEVAIFNRALTEDEVAEAMGGLARDVGAEGKLTTAWGALKASGIRR